MKLKWNYNNPDTHSLTPVFFFFKYFFGLFWLYLIVQLKSWTGNRVREGEGHAAKGPGPGVEPGSAAEPRHMGRARATDWAMRPPDQGIIEVFSA